MQVLAGVAQIVCLWILLFPLLLHAGEEDVGAGVTDTIDFLYIDANAGEAAGGHTALRIGDFIFHYQFFPDSTFLLVREPWTSFRFLYNDLHNRSIAIASLPLDPPVAARIRNHFTELLMEQQRFLHDLQQLQDEEVIVLEMLSGKAELAVSGLGFFAEERSVPNLSSLLLRLQQQLGPVFLMEALSGAERSLARVMEDGETTGRLAEKLDEALTLKEALAILTADLPLTEDACLGPIEGEASLDDGERRGLEQFADYLGSSIASLLTSSRPDRGEALLLQTARYRAVERSLAQNRLLTLDPFFDGMRTVQLTDEEIGGGRQALLRQGLFNQAQARRHLFFKEKGHPEIAYSLLETSRARAWELSRVNDERRRVRILTGVTLPSREKVVPLAGRVPDRVELLVAENHLQREIRLRQQVRDNRYGYNLFISNCATELIRSLNSSFADPESGNRALGGWLEPDDGLVFIPFLFYRQAKAAFSLEDEQFLQARRLRNLEDRYDEEENDLLVWLRESNTLSSTLYSPRSKDAPFLFFTDDTLLLRPVQGVLNVGYALLYGVAGIFTLPFDGGEAVHQAARGIFYSLPELAFGNIRKGSYAMGEAEGRVGP